MDKQVDQPLSSRAADGTTSGEPPAKRLRFEDQVDSSPDPAIEQIDPQGDLVIAVGTNPNKYMRISAKLMTMISEVFEALLHAGFAESQSSHKTVETAIKLPDDDPDSMRVMIQMAHHQIQDPKTVDVHILPQILVACDKYGCVERFGFLLRGVWSSWLDHYGLEKPKSDGQAAVDTGTMVEAVCMAALFEDRERFKEAMKLLFKHATKEELESMSGLALLAMMRDGFEQGLKASWEAAVTGAQEWLYDSVKQWIDGLADGDPICARTERRLGIAVHVVKKYKLDQGEQGIGPTARFFDTERKVAEILRELSHKDELLPAAVGKKACACKPCAARYELGVFMVRPWDEYTASWGCACYDCFREGKYKADPEVRGCKHN